MEETDKIKVLILEDEDGQLEVALAGLIPNVPDGAVEIATDTRSNLAKANFSIQHAYTIKDAIQKLDKFNPDLLIIDVNLGDNGGTNFNGEELKDGIDFYRFAAIRKPRTKRILYSVHVRDVEVNSKLTPEEWKNFIPKALDRAGYEILAGRIQLYLKQIAQKIVSALTKDVRDEISRVVDKLSFDEIKNYPYRFGDRTFRIKHLLLSCSYPLLIEGSEEYVAELKYNETAIVELKNLIRQKAVDTEPRYRAKWKRDHMIDAINDYHQSFREECESSEIIPGLNTIITTLHSNINMPSYERFPDLSYGNYRGVDDIGKTLHNDDFRAKFINALIVRRWLLLLERFSREFADKNLRKIKEEYKDFFRFFINHTIQGVKRNKLIYQSNNMGQVSDELNLGFNLNDFREKVNIEDYSLLECETEWFDSKEYFLMKEDLKKKVLLRN